MIIKRKSLLILAALILTASCVTNDTGLNFTIAAERRDLIDSFDGPGTLNYWYYEVPGMDKVLIDEEVYLDDLYFDIYYPPGFDFKKPLPVLISAEPRTHERRISAEEKSIRLDRSSFSLGQIMAASGIAVIIYEVHHPVDDVEPLLQYLNENRGRLKIDTDRTAVWTKDLGAFSALRTTSKKEFRKYFTPRALILSGPIFHGPYDIPVDVPILVSKTFDVGNMAEGTKIFLKKAEREGKKIVLFEYRDGEPDFENHIDSAETRRIIKGYIDFLKTNLGVK